MSRSQTRHYIDFNLCLTRPPTGEGCQVALLPTPEVGEIVTSVVVPATDGPSPDALPMLARKQITPRNLIAFGKGLANWLLPGTKNEDPQSIRSLFVEALKYAGNAGGVRLRLIIADHALKQWPWEYIYFNPTGVDGPETMSGFLALDPRISIVRHEPLPFPHPTRLTTNADITNLRMVIAAASPKTQTKLDVTRELGYIAEALEKFAVDGVRITLVPLPDATVSEVVQALEGDGSTFIFHFAGHGTTEAVQRDTMNPGQIREEGWLYFVHNKMEQSEHRVRADDLAKQLQAANVRLAVFGACESGQRSERYPWDGVAGALARRNIPAIIGMQYKVLDAYAITFARAFYAALAAGLSLDEACTAGRLAMYGEMGEKPDQEELLEWGVPVLYSRLPDGVILPERMDQAGEVANQKRMTIQQTIDTITQTGQVIGLKAEKATGDFSVTQGVRIVDGTLIGIEISDSGSGGFVVQDIGTVTGSVVGVKIDNFGNG